MGPLVGSGSLQVNVTTTGALYQLNALAARSGAPRIVGNVSSMLNLGETNGAAVSGRSPSPLRFR